MAHHKVLYVDDEKVNLFLFERMFRDEFNLVCASSGSEALEIIEENPEISVVFSDMNMPSMNGIEFITKAKSSHSNIAYLILTGYMINKEIKGALNDGLILECFHKPFNKEKIVGTVSKLIAEK